MLFSLYDTKAECFGNLFEARTDEEAKRIFISLLLTGDINNITQYPQDYVLNRIGDFDNKCGTLSGTVPIQVITGFEAKQFAKQYYINQTTPLIEEKGESLDGSANSNTDCTQDSDCLGQGY